MEIQDIILKLELKEKRIRKRIVLLTLIPILSSIILITYTSIKVIESRKELNSILILYYKAKKENENLRAQNDSLISSLKASTQTLGRAASVLWNFKEFIDQFEPELRTSTQARFFIRFRMLEEKIRGDYEYLSRNVSELPSINDENDWIVIVECNISMEDLEATKKDLISIYGKDKIAIYKDANNIFALAVIGNGSFTRAYRLNVELRDKYGYYGAYYRGINNWGKDYLK